MAKADENNSDEQYNFIRCYAEDKNFFIGNSDLEKYLVFKHKEIPKRQEDFFHLVRLEMEEILNNVQKKK